MLSNSRILFVHLWCRRSIRWPKGEERMECNYSYYYSFSLPHESIKRDSFMCFYIPLLTTSCICFTPLWIHHTRKRYSSFPQGHRIIKKKHHRDISFLSSPPPPSPKQSSFKVSPPTTRRRSFTFSVYLNLWVRQNKRDNNTLSPSTSTSEHSIPPFPLRWHFRPFHRQISRNFVDSLIKTNRWTLSIFPWMLAVDVINSWNFVVFRPTWWQLVFQLNNNINWTDRGRLGQMEIL